MTDSRSEMTSHSGELLYHFKKKIIGSRKLLRGLQNFLHWNVPERTDKFRKDLLIMHCRLSNAKRMLQKLLIAELYELIVSGTPGSP